MALNEDLDQIEKAMKLLQIEWEKFFGGVERKPPIDLRPTRKLLSAVLLPLPSGQLRCTLQFVTRKR